MVRRSWGEVGPRVECPEKGAGRSRSDLRASGAPRSGNRSQRRSRIAPSIPWRRRPPFCRRIGLVFQHHAAAAAVGADHLATSFRALVIRVRPRGLLRRTGDRFSSCNLRGCKSLGHARRALSPHRRRTSRAMNAMSAPRPTATAAHIKICDQSLAISGRADSIPYLNTAPLHLTPRAPRRNAQRAAPDFQPCPSPTGRPYKMCSTMSSGRCARSRHSFLADRR